MPYRKSAARLKLAGKIRKQREDQKKGSYSRPKEDPTAIAVRKRLAGRSGGLRSAEQDKKMAEEANRARARMRLRKKR